MVDAILEAKKAYCRVYFSTEYDNGYGAIMDKALEAAIEAYEAARAEGWQPIETAPVNKSVLVYIPNAEHYGEGVYRGLQVDMGTGRRWQVNGLHMGRDCGHDQQPTHWMPLPSAPQPPSEKKQPHDHD